MSEIVKKFQDKIGVEADGVFGEKTLIAATKYYNFSIEKSAHFFGQLSYETGSFKFFIELLNYSAARLKSVFAKYFKDMTDKEIEEYAGNPEKIANYVYANRMGSK
jgi:putative chitinase